jgi:hypothetical protein
MRGRTWRREDVSDYAVFDLYVKMGNAGEYNVPRHPIEGPGEFPLSHHKKFPLALVCGATLLGCALARPGEGQQLLPDLIAWDYDDGFDLDPRYDIETIDNRVLYRFDVAIPNIGEGPMEVREETDGTISQTVFQRIHLSGGGIDERVIGTFPEPANTFGHLWFQGLAQYNLYEALPDGMGGHTRGELVSTQDKTSMGIVDSGAYDLTLPGAPQSRVYDSANDAILGISIGWADIYDRNLPGQWVDVTGLADGDYLLEVVIDPYERVDETDDTNNSTELLVNLVIPAPKIHPGDYNDDGVVDAADYVVWRNDLGTTGLALGTGADGNGNGVIDAGDHTVWREYFGELAGGSVALATVPEPHSAIALGLFAGLVAWLRRTRGVGTCG